MKRLFVLVLSLIFVLSFAACDTGGQAPAREPESAPPPASEPAPSSSEPASVESGPDPVPEPETQPAHSELQIIQSPDVPHGAELDGVDFSAMDREELTALLQPVLDRAAFFCQFGRIWYPETTNLITDENREAAILRPYEGMDLDYHPFLNLPYRTAEELRQDMATVFTPENFDGDLKFVFDGMTDHEGRLYYVGIINGYLPERQWELDELEIVSAEKTKLTISAPVSWPATPALTWGDAQRFTAPLRFEITGGYIIVDSSYFAVENS